MSFGSEYQVDRVVRLVNGRDVDLVDPSLAVTRQLEGNLCPRAGRALAFGCRTLAVNAEARNAFDLAAVKCGIQQNLFAFTCRNVDKGGAQRMEVRSPTIREKWKV